MWLPPLGAHRCSAVTRTHARVQTAILISLCLLFPNQLFALPAANDLRAALRVPRAWGPRVVIPGLAHHNCSRF